MLVIRPAKAKMDTLKLLYFMIVALNKYCYILEQS